MMEPRNIKVRVARNHGETLPVPTDPAIIAAADFAKASRAYFAHSWTRNDDPVALKLRRENDEAFWRCVTTKPTTDRGRIELLRAYIFDLFRDAPSLHDPQPDFYDLETWIFEPDWFDDRGPELVKNALRGLS